MQYTLRRLWHTTAWGERRKEIEEGEEEIDSEEEQIDSEEERNFSEPEDEIKAGVGMDMEWALGHGGDGMWSMMCSGEAYIEDGGEGGGYEEEKE